MLGRIDPRALHVRVSERPSAWMVELLQGVSFLCCLFLLGQNLLLPALAQPFVISEIMANPQGGGFLDEDREASDWIEIYNRSDTPQNLGGWSLSDSENSPRKWSFPEKLIQPYEFLTVFASGKDYRDASRPLHTNFKLSQEGEFLGLFSPEGISTGLFKDGFPRQFRGVSYAVRHQGEIQHIREPSFKFKVPENADVDQIWMDRKFDDSEWSQGSGGIGFDTNSGKPLLPFIDTNIASAMRSKSSSLYIRYTFHVPSEGGFLRLRMLYDDGFLMYLNGQKIFRKNTSPRVRWNSRASVARVDGEERLPEYLSLSRVDGIVSGENVIAIHGLNTRNTDRDFLFQMEMHQWSELGDTEYQMGYAGEPSPEVPNGAIYPEVLEMPSITQTGRVFSESVRVEISHPDPSAVIHYTLDGRIPLETSQSYTNPILLKSSAQVNARAFHPSKVTSDVATDVFSKVHTSTLTVNSNLPVITLDTQGGRVSSSRRQRALMHLFDRGEDGRSSLSSQPVFQGLASIKIRGSSTEGRPKKAYSMEIQDIHGRDRDVSLLGMPEDSDWILYAPYNFDRALIRNAWVYELTNQMGRYAVRARFCEVYLNTHRTRQLDPRSYLGVYVLMEKIKRGNNRVAVDRLLLRDTKEPQVTGGYMLKIDRLDPGDGGFTGASQQLAFVEPKEQEIQASQKKYLTNFLSAMHRTLRDRDYQAAVPAYDAYIDEAAWIDFHIINEFTKNPDGFRLSTYMYLPRNGRLTFGPVWDFDRTMGPDDDGRAANPVGWSEVRRYGWWGNLLRNPNFEQRYIDRWLELRKGVMSVANMHGVIERMASELSESSVRNYQKWPILRGNQTWSSEIRQLKNWVKKRAEWMDRQYLEPPRFKTPVGAIPADGLVRVEMSDMPLYYTLDGSDPRLPGGALSPSAFSLTPSNPHIAIDDSTKIFMRNHSGDRRDKWSGAVKGLFLSQEKPLLIFSEIMYHPADPPAPSGFSEAELEFIELWNHGDKPIFMEGMTVTGAVQYTFPSHVLQPGVALVLAAHPEALSAHVAGLGLPVFGPYVGRLGNGGETVVLSSPDGRLLDEVQFDDQDGWPEKADGEGASLQRIRTDVSNQHAWRDSAQMGGDPGRMVLPSPIRPTIQTLAGGIMRLEFEAAPGVHHLLLSATSLNDADWKTVQEWPPVDELSLHHMDFRPTGHHLFFRIIAQ
jgi:hypothetical protein